KLSKAQRELLREGLRGYAMRPFHLVHGKFAPGSFELKGMMSQFEDRRVRASKRAAAGLAIVRLVKRGLLERCARGRWRLSSAGLEVALRLEPDFKLPSVEELGPQLELAAAINAKVGSKGRRRKGERAAP